MKYTSKKMLTAMALAFSVLAGCNSSPPGGVTTPGDKEGFKITAPTIPVMLKQGDKQTVTITLNREANFKQDVVLSVDAPKGLKVEMPKSLLGKVTVKAAEAAEVPLSISAEKDAALGEQTVKVTGTPEKGSATSVDIKVNVSKP
jgi:uncharacterized membrane protein